MSRDPASDQSPREDSRPGPEFKVELIVDGRRLPLKAFLHDIIGGSVAGMVRGLEDSKAPSEIELRIRRRKTGDSGAV